MVRAVLGDVGNARRAGSRRAEFGLKPWRRTLRWFLALVLFGCGGTDPTPSTMLDGGRDEKMALPQPVTDAADSAAHEPTDLPMASSGGTGPVDAAGTMDVSSPDAGAPAGEPDAASDAGSEATGMADAGMPGAEVFEQDAIVEYAITMDSADAEHLEEFGDDEEYLPAALSVRGGDIDLRFERIGLRHKGAYSLHHCFDSGRRSYRNECAKLSYKIRFDEYDEEARFFGFKRLNLHAMSVDGSKLKEQLAYDLFNAFGVDAPRTAYAKLTINGESLGLFAVVEQIDGRYTAFHYPRSGDGNLYKEVWPKPGFDDEHFLDHLETNEDPEDNPDVSDIQAFSAAVGATTADDFQQVMDAFIDIDEVLRYIAVDRAIRNWDGFVTFYSPNSPHNFYWYHEGPPNDRFVLTPWDMDNTFWEYDPIMHPEEGGRTSRGLPDWNVKPRDCSPIALWEAGGSTRATPPGCDHFINMLAATGWSRFVELGQELLDGPLQLATMNDKLDRWQALIEDAVREDPYVDNADWQDEVHTLRETLEEIVDDFELHLDEGYIEQ